MRRRSVLVAASLGAALWRGKSRAEDDDPEALRAPSAISAVRPASPLPEVAFETLEGALRPLAGFRGKPLVLNFWATWCAPCVRELPELDALARTDAAVSVLAVSADHGGAETVRGFLASHPVAHATILLDPASEATHALGVVGFPTTLIVDAAGLLRGRLIGPARWSQAGAAIEALLR